MRNLFLTFRNLLELTPHYFKSNKYYGEISSSLMNREFFELKNQIRSMDLQEHEGTKKFLNVSFYLRESIIRALKLGLEKGPKRKVLDLGCGAGYFLLVCRYFGHQVFGLDISNNQFYNTIIPFFGIERFETRIEAQKEVTLPETNFDLITSFSVSFDSKEPRWGKDDWLFFLESLKGNLNPGGQVLLRLNPHPKSLHTQVGVEAIFNDAEGYLVRKVDYRTVSLTKRNA